MFVVVLQQVECNHGNNSQVFRELEENSPDMSLLLSQSKWEWGPDDHTHDHHLIIILQGETARYECQNREAQMKAIESFYHCQILDLPASFVDN